MVMKVSLNSDIDEQNEKGTSTKLDPHTEIDAPKEMLLSIMI